MSSLHASAVKDRHSITTLFHVIIFVQGATRVATKRLSHCKRYGILLNLKCNVTITFPFSNGMGFPMSFLIIIYFDRVKVFLLKRYVDWLIIYLLHSFTALPRHLNDAKQLSLGIAYRDVFQDIAIHVHGGEASVYVAGLCSCPLYGIAG